MAKTRPGIDRITKQQLQASHAYAVLAMHRHIAGCLTCKKAGSWLAARCGAWWELAKAEHRAARKLREYAQPETRGMVPMFTEEQCDLPPY